MRKPRLLDLFCCAGGASVGYARAGFEVVGVDIDPQPRYPFEFIQADALTVLDELLLNGCYELPPDQRAKRRCLDLDEINAFAASPPCQAYSVTAPINPNSDSYPRLIAPMRERLIATGKPYVIENVEGARAEMLDPVTLCGSQFGKYAIRNGHLVYLRRHRLCESNVLIPEAGPHTHQGRAFPVFGHGVGGKNWPDYLKGPGTSDFARQLMGIDWMNRAELGESIPPAYTEYIGEFLLDAVIAELEAA